MPEPANLSQQASSRSESEHITPEEVLRKLTAQHDRIAMDMMRESEYGPSGAFIPVMQESTADIINRTTYSEHDTPRNWDIVLATGVFLDMNSGEASGESQEEQDLEKVAYRFGQRGLTQEECMDLIGPNFSEEVKTAIAQGKKPYREAIIHREILPGIVVYMHVVDENNPFGETPNNQSNYRVTTVYGSIPLVGQTPLTGKALFENVVTAYKADFHDRFTVLLSGNEEQRRTFLEQGPLGSGETVEQILAHIVMGIRSRGEQALPSGDLLDVLIVPGYISDDLRLYLLGKMEKAFFDANHSFPAITGADLNEHLKIIGSEYRAMGSRQGIQDDDKEKNATHSIENGEEIVKQNLELLAIKLVKEVPYWELNDETNRALVGIKIGDGGINGKGETVKTLDVYYETATGKIGAPFAKENVSPGDYSRLHTYVANSGRRMEQEVSADDGSVRWVIVEPGVSVIALTQREKDVTVAQISQGLTDLKEESDRILPERLDPKNDMRMLGVKVQWGQSSTYGENAKGDDFILQTIKQFDEHFGPAK